MAYVKVFDTSAGSWAVTIRETIRMHHHAQPFHGKHRFDPAKASTLLDPARRLIPDTLAWVQGMGVPYDRQSGTRVVDLGCGAGFFTPALLEVVGEQGRVTAVELQQPVLDLLRDRLVPHPRLVLVQADLTATGLAAQSQDVAFVAFTLHEVDLQRALAEVRRLLRPEGYLAVTEWGEWHTCPERPAREPGGLPSRSGPPADERLPVATLRQHLAEAGFHETAYGTALGGCQYWLTARCP
jgi:SAM-dependent methyltransferase